MSKETFAGEPLDPHAAADAIERLRGEVERLTQHNADLVRANQHSMDWFNDALARAEAAERERDEAREFAKEGWANLEIEKLRVQTLEKGDEIFKIRAQCADAISQAAAERDAALARAEAAERERDERNARMWETAEELGRTEARANAAEANVAKLREALKPFAMLAHCLDYKNSQWLDHETHWMRVVNFNPEPTVGDLRRARTALQETEQ